MAKVVNPRYFYRVYTLAPISREKGFFRKFLIMQDAVNYWLECHYLYGVLYRDIIVEKRKGDEWVCISKRWTDEEQARFELFEHLAELELLEYHYKYCKEGR